MHYLRYFLVCVYVFCFVFQCRGKKTNLSDQSQNLILKYLKRFLPVCAPWWKMRESTTALKDQDYPSHQPTPEAHELHVASSYVTHRIRAQITSGSSGTNFTKKRASYTAVINSSNANGLCKFSYSIIHRVELLDVNLSLPGRDNIFDKVCNILGRSHVINTRTQHNIYLQDR